MSPRLVIEGTHTAARAERPGAARRALRLAASISVLAFPAAQLSAQQAVNPPVSPVTVTPETLSPESERPAVRVDIPAAGAIRPPAGAENAAVALADVSVEGAFPAVAEEVAAIVAPLEGQRVTLERIYAAASQIEAAHARRGYVLARVSVPPQELADGGTMRMVVTDGYIEKVDVTALPERIREPVLRRAEPLVGKRQVTIAEIEQALSLAMDIPGLALRSTLVRGEAPGTVGLVLEGDQRLVTGRIGIDNQLDPSLGRWGANLQLVLNSALGLGEQIYGFASSDYAFTRSLSGDPRQRVLGAGAIVPIGEGRLILNPEATFATTTPDTAATVLRTRGVLRRLTMRGQGVLRKTRSDDIRLGLTVEQIDVRNEALDFPITLNHDRYMAARLSATADFAGQAGGRSNISAQFSSGMGDIGAITPAEALASRTPYSRIGASPEFLKLTLAGRTAVPLSGRGEFALSVTGQTTFGDPVFRSEQFTLEGDQGLSAFVGGETAVDAGAVARAEVSLFETVRSDRGTAAILAPYAFGAFGAGRLERPSAVERGNIDAWNIGAGIRASLLDRIDIKLEYARSFSRIPELDEGDRVNVSASLRI